MDLKFLLFFDDPAIESKLDPAIAKALSQLGAYTRRDAKSSLKYGPGSARPGDPPIVHRSSGFTRKKKSKGAVKQQPSSPLRELIYFGYDPEMKTMVAGPILGGSRTGAPQTLERRTHPFMAPALERQEAKLPNLFTDCVR